MTVMYDYLSEVTPDISNVLDIDIQHINISGSKNQEVDSFFASERAVYTFDSDSVFYVNIDWASISAVDAAVIWDLYLGDACGRGKSFTWVHPSDGYTYVVKFGMGLGLTQRPQQYGIPPMVLKVFGYSIILTGNWILDGGVWADTGEWDDTEVWEDS